MNSQQLQKTPLFQTLDDDTCNWLLGQAKRRVYQKGEVVFWEGEPALGLYWLQVGWLKAVKQLANGREQILQFFEPAHTFHEIGGFTQQANPATVIALDEAHVWLIPREAMAALLRDQPHFAQHVIVVMAQRMQYLVGLVQDLSLRPVIGRLARLILESADENTFHRPSWFTQTELAARLGTVPDVVQRTLRGLEADGLIEVQRRRIHIKDRAKLAELIVA
ncbi:MAG: Crp/Fnr family transcriptional regulator [Ardenticatenaceae bacterium]|nr:Crp/Fnr family transcriptional regulator [Ardenticatenaceae bacterium]